MKHMDRSGVSSTHNTLNWSPSSRCTLERFLEELAARFGVIASFALLPSFLLAWLLPVSRFFFPDLRIYRLDGMRRRVRTNGLQLSQLKVQAYLRTLDFRECDGCNEILD